MEKIQLNENMSLTLKNADNLRGKSKELHKQIGKLCLHSDLSYVEVNEVLCLVNEILYFKTICGKNWSGSSEV